MATSPTWTSIRVRYADAELLRQAGLRLSVEVGERLSLTELAGAAIRVALRTPDAVVADLRASKPDATA